MHAFTYLYMVLPSQATVFPNLIFKSSSSLSVRTASNSSEYRYRNQYDNNTHHQISNWQMNGLLWPPFCSGSHGRKTKSTTLLLNGTRGRVTGSSATKQNEITCESSHILVGNGQPPVYAMYSPCFSGSAFSWNLVMPAVPIAFCCYQWLYPSFFHLCLSIFFFLHLPIPILALNLSKCHWCLPLDSSYLKLVTTRLPLLQTTLKELAPSFHQADTGTCA